jgi:hypothetical protein
VLLLEEGTLKEARIYSQESRMKVENLEREEGAQALNLKEYSHFSEWSTAQGGRWGLFIGPHLKRAIGGIFHQTILVGLSEGWSLTGQVQFTGLVQLLHRTSLVKAFGSQFSDQTSLMGLSRVRSKVSRIRWIHQTSPVILKKICFWKVKHLDLSPNYFDASLLIVRLSYDSSKI